MPRRRPKRDLWRKQHGKRWNAKRTANTKGIGQNIPWEYKGYAVCSFNRKLHRLDILAQGFTTRGGASDWARESGPLEKSPFYVVRISIPFGIYFPTHKKPNPEFHTRKIVYNLSYKSVVF